MTLKVKYQFVSASVDLRCGVYVQFMWLESLCTHLFDLKMANKSISSFSHHLMEHILWVKEELYFSSNTYNIIMFLCMKMQFCISLNFSRHISSAWVHNLLCQTFIWNSIFFFIHLCFHHFLQFFVFSFFLKLTIKIIIVVGKVQVR